MPSVTNVKVVPPSMSSGLARVVREDEDGAVVRRLGSPPAPPVAAPLAADRAEHVATHDVGASREDRVEFGAMVVGVLEHPLVDHLGGEVAEGRLLALVRPGREAVGGDGQICIDAGHVTTVCAGGGGEDQPPPPVRRHAASERRPSSS